MKYITIKNSDGATVAINVSKILCIVDYVDYRKIDLGGDRPINTHYSLEELLSLVKNV